MKNKHQARGNSTVKLGSSIGNIVLTCLIVLIPLVAVQIYMVSLYAASKDTGIQYIREQSDVWEQAFLAAESERVDVVFTSISDSNSLDYNELRVAANTVIEDTTELVEKESNINIRVSDSVKKSVSSKKIDEANIEDGAEGSRLQVVEVPSSTPSRIDESSDSGESSGTEESSEESVSSTSSESSHQEDRSADSKEGKATESKESESFSRDTNSSVDTTDSQSQVVETGPIYFDDLLMIRYVNAAGDIQVLNSMNDGDNILVFGQNDLPEYSSKFSDSSIVDGSLDASEVDTSKLSENEYIAVIASCTRALLISNDPEDINNAFHNAVQYFTASGKNSIVGVREALRLSKDTDLELQIGMAGKSDTMKVVKDRVYLQFKYGDNMYLNVIVKLNDNLKVYDIDII